MPFHLRDFPLLALLMAHRSKPIAYQCYYFIVYIIQGPYAYASFPYLLIHLGLIILVFLLVV